MGDPFTPVERFLLTLADLPDGGTVGAAAAAAGLHPDVAATTARLHGWPDLTRIRYDADLIRRRHAPPGEPIMTEPPTRPTGIPVKNHPDDEPEGQPSPAAEATCCALCGTPFGDDTPTVRLVRPRALACATHDIPTDRLIQVPIPADLDADVDLADIREDEQERRRERDEAEYRRFAGGLTAGERERLRRGGRVDAPALAELGHLAPSTVRAATAQQEQELRRARDRVEELAAFEREQRAPRDPDLSALRLEQGARASDVGAFFTELGRRMRERADVGPFDTVAAVVERYGEDAADVLTERHPNPMSASLRGTLTALRESCEAAAARMSAGFVPPIGNGFMSAGFVPRPQSWDPRHVADMNGILSDLSIVDDGEEAPPMVGSVLWPAPDPREQVTEAAAAPLDDVTATPVPASSATLVFPMVTMLDGDGVPTVVREAVVDVAIDPRGLLDLITGEDDRAVPVTWTVRHRITPMGADIIDALAELLDGEGVPE